MRKYMVLVTVLLLTLTGCKANVEDMTLGEVKDAAIEQSKAVVESLKALTAAVTEEEFKSEGSVVQIITKRGLALANVSYDIATGTLGYTLDGTDYRFIQGNNGEKNQYIVDMADDEQDIKAVEAFLTDRAAESNGFISSDAVTQIMTVVRDKAEEKTLTFDGGESSVVRKDGRVVVTIRF